MPVRFRGSGGACADPMHGELAAVAIGLLVLVPWGRCGCRGPSGTPLLAARQEKPRQCTTDERWWTAGKID